MERTLAVEQWGAVFGLLEKKKVASEIELKLSGKRGDGNELFKLPQVLQKGQILS